MTGKYAAPAPKAPRSRKRRVIIAAILAAVISMGTAIAVVTARAPIAGSVQSNAFNPSWVSASNQGGQVDLDCAVTVTAGTLNLNVTEAYQGGGECTVGGDVTVSANSGQGRVTGITLPGLPVGWEAELVAGCGAVIPQTPATAAVVFELRMTAAAEGGASGTFTDAGVTLSPASQIGAGPITCPVFAGS